MDIKQLKSYIKEQMSRCDRECMNSEGQEYMHLSYERIGYVSALETIAKLTKSGREFDLDLLCVHFHKSSELSHKYGLDRADEKYIQKAKAFQSIANYLSINGHNGHSTNGHNGNGGGE